MVPENSLPDSWDHDDAELNLSPLITPTEPVVSAKENTGGRSLRPGGNKSFNINLHQAVATIRFTKAEIVAMRPTDKFANPLSMYGNITPGEPTGGPSNQKSSGSGSGWNKGQGQGQG